MDFISQIFGMIHSRHKPRELDFLPFSLPEFIEIFLDILQLLVHGFDFEQETVSLLEADGLVKSIPDNQTLQVPQSDFFLRPP